MQKPFFLNAKRHLPHTHSCYRTSEEILVHQFIRVLAITGLNQLRSIGRNQNLVTLFSSKGLTLLKEKIFSSTFAKWQSPNGSIQCFSFCLLFLVIVSRTHLWLSIIEIENDQASMRLSNQTFNRYRRKGSLNVYRKVNCK